MSASLKAAPIRFAVFSNGAVLDPWQKNCLDALLALPDLRLEAQLTLRNAAQLDASGVDFILSFADEPCPTAMLDLPRYGVWRFQFGGRSAPSGAPIGFWEVYENQPITGALLTRVHGNPDRVAVLREGYFRTQSLSCRKNQEQLLSRIAPWPAQICSALLNGASEIFSDPVILKERPGTPRFPNRGHRLLCRVRILARVASSAWQSLFRHDQWNIGVVNQPVAAFLQSERRAATNWLPPQQRSAYLADPFGVLHQGRLTILCEHFSYRDNIGTIVATDPLQAPAYSRVTIGPQPGIHMSYPLVMNVDGRMLCMPETSAAREVTTYDLEKFPDRWVKAATLLHGPEVVDATLFHHSEHWWIAGSEIAPKGANCELYLWYADALTGPWHPHPGNPVKVDIRSARPAGPPFIDDGVLYRPAQDCSKTYGGRVIINRVLTLTPTAFREEAHIAVEPDSAGPYPKGLHTLSGVGELTLIDGKRSAFIPAEFFRVLGNSLRSLLGRPKHA